MACKLRIPVSVFFGLLTVALCVLWVRSFWRSDQWYRMDRSFAMLQSNYGHLSWQYANEKSFTLAGQATPWTHASGPADGRPPFLYWRFNDLEHVFAVPHILLAFLPAAIACLPWIRWSFSLRAMLVATTLVAIVLGLVVWAAR